MIPHVDEFGFNVNKNIFAQVINVTKSARGGIIIIWKRKFRAIGILGIIEV